MQTECRPGRSYPLGATVYPTGTNFSLFSKSASSVELLFFDDPDDGEPRYITRLDRSQCRTYYYWHVFVTGVGHGQLYGYRVRGPHDPEQGLRFDGEKLLIDPYARAVAPSSRFSRAAAAEVGGNCATGIKSVVVDPNLYDWELDTQLDHPYARTVIYEMHVQGFTKHPSSNVVAAKRGTYLGVIDKIPYLKSLEITAVELLPIQHHDTQEAPGGLTNYWGYSPIAFFAPHHGYGYGSEPLSAINEFRRMVKALHQADIEVIIDVVFNHTAEGDKDGPTYSFRGLENRGYYILNDDGARYADYSGTGNTVNTNHSIVRRMILDCLRYWVSEMHVDGFRFDLASIMARDEDGQPMKNPPILWEIESDPVLAGTKIIAEAWDAAGLYQVGSFIGHRWAEWNGQFRDDVRRFVKGDAGIVKRLAARINGSPDLYTQRDREPNRSINFVTSHDGFTINDLVMFEEKHNEANLEQNRDGGEPNYSWNCGVEGWTIDEEIQALRQRQIRNLLTILFISQGTPMILMGDEVRRTQQGNNNAYCQDNAISWFDWAGIEEHSGLLRFVRHIIRITQGFAVFRKENFWRSEDARSDPTVIWHGTMLHQPDWSHDSRSLALEIRSADDDEQLYLMLNAYWEPLTFELPPADVNGNDSDSWLRIIDTALVTPDDIRQPDEAPAIKACEYRVKAHSAVMLLAQRPSDDAVPRAFHVGSDS